MPKQTIMKKNGSLPSSPQPLKHNGNGGRTSPHPSFGRHILNDPHMDKDEQLQLCIQRFVSDAQSMMNQFTEMFVGEVRRFADVCMEFSLAYRSAQEDRDFLAIENRSLKDELEARTGQLEIVNKELRETRDENEELVRRLECFGIGLPDGGGVYGSSSGGSPIMAGNSVRLMDPVAMSRHYAVVNSMPAFPRRYSVATSVASYDDDAITTASSSLLHPNRDQPLLTCSSASPTVPSNSNTLLLITPPPPPEIALNYSSSSLMSNDGKRRSTSLSPDHTTHQSYEQTAVDNTTPKSSSSLDQLPITIGVASRTNRSSIVKNQIDGLSPAVSSSTGTFYDAVSSCGTGSLDDKSSALTDEISRMCALMVAQSDEFQADLGEDLPLEMIIPNNAQTSDESEEADINDNDNDDNVCYVNSTLDSTNVSFISKTPSPSMNYNQHYQTYLSKCHDNERNVQNQDDNNLSNCQIDSELQEQVDNFVPLSRHNSRKKKGTVNVTSAAEMLQQSKWYNGIGSADFLLDSCWTQARTYPESVILIPVPTLEMTRYLLVEVSHFVSPSHFYLIINDEKCGSNVFEDFLESFQNFYQSLGYLLEEEQTHQSNGFIEDDEETEFVNSEWKMYFTSPPPIEQIVVGSYWAAYIDDDYDWRRIQVLQVDDRSSDTKELEILVRDVDSGFSASVSISNIRPLSEELGTIPAFAIRSSLAYLYPQMTKSASSASLPDESGSEWPIECCRLFQQLTYDQILTASIIEIQRDDLTDTEIVQVLLWCSPTTPSESSNDVDEIFINRKLIELNYAANVADNDRWLQRSNETINSTKTSQIIPISQQPVEPTIPEQKEDDKDIAQQDEGLTTLSEISSIKKKKLKTSSTKSKTLSKKKKEKEKEETNGEMGEPNQLIIETPFLTMNNGTSSTLANSSKCCIKQKMNQRSSTAIEICPSFYLSTSSLLHLNRLDLPSIKTDENVDGNCKFPMESCSKLHHDPRLSNWIVQKHSRHVKLKKSSHMSMSMNSPTYTYPTMSYLFRVTNVFDENKIIGILPFGERKLEIDFIQRYIEQLNPNNVQSVNVVTKIESPFRQFVLEMTENYTKFSKDYCLMYSNANHSDYIENYLHTQQNQSIAFYDMGTGLYLRGFMVGKDPDAPTRANHCGSSNDLVISSDNQMTNDMKDKPNENVKRKTLSLKRPKVKFQEPNGFVITPEGTIENLCTKWIIYGIDTGRYYLIQSNHIYRLVEKFSSQKPFAVVCKLQKSSTLTKTIAEGGGGGGSNRNVFNANQSKLQELIQDRFVCLQFHDIDFTTERNLVSLYRLDLPDYSAPSTSTDSTKTVTSPINIIHLL